jgi:hypothetical protein
MVAEGLESFHEVEGICGHSGAGSLNLAPEVFGLEDVELAVVGKVRENVLLETDDCPLAIVVVVSGAGQVCGVKSI